MLAALLARPALASSAAEKRRELAAVQKQLEATRRDIEQYKSLEDSLGKELAALQDRNSGAKRRMTQLQRNLRLAEEKKGQLKARLTALGQASGFWRSSLESDLRAYQSHLASRDDAYGTEELWAEHLRRRAILEKGAFVASLEGASTRTAQAARETSLRAVTLLESSRQAKREQATRQQEYEQKKAAVAQAQAKKQAAMARAQELEESARALTRLIRVLGRGRKYRKAGAVARLDVPRNSLDWPAAGSIIKPFGRQRNPELDTWVVSQGILLATTAGAPVQAVERGKVIFAGPFRSYGQVLILDHGSNFFSIYGELGQLLKAKGAAVRTGETIARAGAGAGGGGSVYLELRRGTEALDPLDWLRKK